MTQEYFLGLDVPPDAHRFYQSVTAWARRVHGIHSGVNATAHIMVKLPFADDELALSSQSELRAWLSSVIMAWRRGPVGVELGPVITVAPEEICLDARGNDLRALMRHIQWRSWLRNLRVRPGLPQPRLVLFTGLEEEFFPAALELVSAGMAYSGLHPGHAAVVPQGRRRQVVGLRRFQFEAHRREELVVGRGPRPPLLRLPCGVYTKYI